MSTLHAKAYRDIEGVENVGIVTRNYGSSEQLATSLGGDIPRFTNFEKAIAETSPDAIAIGTYTDSHYDYVKRGLELGLHVFVEKPLAETMEECRELFQLAKEKKRILYVGYILMTHPSWSKFIELSHDLGKPLAMRMNLNQQAKGEFLNTLKNIMQIQSPLVDCGVHYVDIMCQMAQCKPVRVHAVGCNNWDKVPQSICNYGQLQIEFEDGSVGWYEAGWGPNMSETAYFIKDVVGPKGAVSIRVDSDRSDDKDHHVEANTLIKHHAEQVDNEFVHEDEVMKIDEPDHEGLALLEQEEFINCIRNDACMASHEERVMTSLEIVFAADQSIAEKQVIELNLK